MSILAVADRCIKAHRDTLGALFSMKLRLTANTDKINMDRNFIVSKSSLGGMQKFYNRRLALFCRASFEIVWCPGVVRYLYIIYRRRNHTYSNSELFDNNSMIWNLKNKLARICKNFIQLQQQPNFWNCAERSKNRRTIFKEVPEFRGVQCWTFELLTYIIIGS